MFENKIDRGHCPLCGQSNDCAREMGRNEKNCWCVSVIFPAELLELVPEEKKDQACICRTCLRRYRQQQNQAEETVM